MIKTNAELKNLIPPLSQEEYKMLEESILKEGCRDSLIVWDNTIIDGHNRYEICTKHNIPYKTTEKHFENLNEAKAWMINNQLARRNISLYQRAVLALELKPIIAEQAKEQQATQTKQGYQKSDKAVHTTKILAEQAGVSHDTIARVEKIEAQATEEQREKLSKGDASINQVYQDIRREEKRQRVEQVADQYDQRKTESIDIYTTDNKYNIIYADPAWQYWEGGRKNQSLHYQTMTIDEIKALPVERITEDNAILFLWVTYPILKEAFEVMEAWGFKYSTCGFVWVKKNRNADTNFFGLGSWTRANSELCLIGTKGQMIRLDAGISQIVEAPIEEHSKKPEVIRKLITSLVGKLPRIELFSRNTTEGWDVWGNEV